MVISFIILLIMFILFVPIKLKFYTSQSSFNIKFYNIVIFSPEKGLLNNYIKTHFRNFFSPKSNSQNIKQSNLKSKTSSPLHKILNNKKLSISKLYKSLNTNKFKPSLKFIGDIDFELDDAAITAITYGLASNLNPILYFLFSRVFTVKTLKLNIKPHFTGKNIFNFSINSIISLNIAQIIYILVLTIKCFEIKKEVAP